MKWPMIRNVTMFIAGMTGVAVMTIAWLKGQEPNQSLMLLFAAMMGLPVFLHADEKKKNGGE